MLWVLPDGTLILDDASHDLLHLRKIAHVYLIVADEQPERLAQDSMRVTDGTTLRDSATAHQFVWKFSRLLDPSRMLVRNSFVARLPRWGRSSNSVTREEAQKRRCRRPPWSRLPLSTRRSNRGVTTISAFSSSVIRWMMTGSEPAGDSANPQSPRA